MVIIINVISILLLLGLISSPILLFIKLRKTKMNFLIYLILGLVISVVITLAFAWWADYSNRLLLNHYGYDFDAMTDSERYGNIKSVDMEKVKQIETSLFGIGWWLKAIMTYVFYFPYLLIVYPIGIILEKNRKKA